MAEPEHEDVMTCVVIRRSEASELPNVCVSCGKHACTNQSEKYTWNPSWVVLFFFMGLLPWIILSSVTRRSITLAMPLCEHHSNRGTRALMVVLGGVVLAGAMAGAGYFIQETEHELGVQLMFGAIGLFVVVGITAIFLSDNQIRVKAIDDRCVVLEGVSEDFAFAVEDGRRECQSARPEEDMDLDSAEYSVPDAG
jgi:hypothetical protein